MSKTHHKSLTDLITGATAGMVALTAFVLYLLHETVVGSGQIWAMLGASACATLLIMSLLHAELQRLYQLLAEGEIKASLEARRDSLTNVGNRKFLIEELEKRCSIDDATAKEALLLMDLNNFKRVNDTHGHQFGDQLITAVAQRLATSFPHSILSRLGGDEFALIVRVENLAQLNEFSDDVCQRLEEPFDLSKGQYFASGSVGATFIGPAHGASETLRRADLALYDAKAAKLRYRIFDDDLDRFHSRRIRLAENFRDCLRTGEGLSAHYQGIFSPSGEPIALEALLRWTHPTFGPVPATEIVSVAEDSQLISECGIFMARSALRAAKEYPTLKVCLNVSSLQLLDNRYPLWLANNVAACGVRPEQIIIEVRECDLMEQAPRLSEALGLLSSFGFCLAVDNFGTGISSLADLKRRGVTIVKLDGRALRAAQESANLSIIRATVELAKALGMKVIAAGVDTAHAKATAIQAGCDHLQGFHIAQPADLADVPARRIAA